MTPWLYKRVIIPKTIYAAVAWWDCLGKARIGTSVEGRMHYDHRGNENNSNESTGDALGSANIWNSGGVYSTDGSRLPTEVRSEKPGIGHNRIWEKADKVDSKFSMINDHVTLWRTFG